MAYIHGIFKNVQTVKNDNNNTRIGGDTIEVRIVSGGSTSPEYIIGNTYDSDIHFSDDPVTISVAINDMFDTVIKKSCSISLVSSIFLGDILYAQQDNSVTVKVYKNGTIIFDGFAEPNTYNQPWSHPYDQYTINCFDRLSILQNKYWSYNMSSEIRTFKNFLQAMGLSSFNVFYDNSAKLNNASAFDKLGVSTNAFLGNDESDVKSYEESLDMILRYMNLHIIQEGSDFYIFNWNSIKNNSAQWINLFGSGTPMSASNISISKNDYSDESTNLTIDEAYNQIKVRANIKPISDAVPNPFEDGDLENIYAGNPELCISEAWYDESKHRSEFARLIKSEMFRDPDSINVDASGNQWHAKDWFMNVQKNSKWTLRYHDTNVLDYITYNGNTPTYQSNILKYAYNNKFMPLLIKIGSGSEIKNGAVTRRSSINVSNYLVISSCAGWGVKSANYGDRQFNDKASLLAAIDNARSYASGTMGIFSYDNGSAVSVSPKGDNETNFITIKGNIRLEPHHCKTGTGVVAPIIRSGENASFGDTLAYVNSSVESKFWFGSSFACKNDGTIGYYQQIPWRAQTPTSTHTQDTTTGVNYLSPPVGLHGIGVDYYQNRFTYNKSKTSDGWTSDDTINKIPILECELKVGDKYCVEDMVNLDEEGCPTFHWYTAEECQTYGFDSKSITLGFNPTIGDFIMGKDYEFTNTADGRIQKVKGMAIPVKKSDALTGNITFKIKGVLNVDWNGYFDVEGSMSTTGVHGEGTYNLWQNVASIWIKDLEIKFDGDTSALASSSTNADVMYMSNEQHNYINKRDDIEFNLVTQLTNEEAATFGMSNATSYNNVINMDTNLAVENITEPNGTNRAEKLYVDQYYNYYYTPKIMINTQIFDEGYSMLNTYTFSDFGKTIPMSIDYDLRYNTITLSSRQV